MLKRGAGAGDANLEDQDAFFQERGAASVHSNYYEPEPKRARKGSADDDEQHVSAGGGRGQDEESGSIWWWNKGEHKGKLCKKGKGKKDDWSKGACLWKGAGKVDAEEGIFFAEAKGKGGKKKGYSYNNEDNDEDHDVDEVDFYKGGWKKGKVCKGKKSKGGKDDDDQNEYNSYSKGKGKRKSSKNDHEYDEENFYKGDWLPWCWKGKKAGDDEGDPYKGGKSKGGGKWLGKMNEGKGKFEKGVKNFGAVSAAEERKRKKDIDRRSKDKAKGKNEKNKDGEDKKKDEKKDEAYDPDSPTFVDLAVTPNPLRSNSPPRILAVGSGNVGCEASLSMAYLGQGRKHSLDATVLEGSRVDFLDMYDKLEQGDTNLSVLEAMGQKMFFGVDAAKLVETLSRAGRQQDGRGREKLIQQVALLAKGGAVALTVTKHQFYTGKVESLARKAGFWYAQQLNFRKEEFPLYAESFGDQRAKGQRKNDNDEGGGGGQKSKNVSILLKYYIRNLTDEQQKEQGKATGLNSSSKNKCDVLYTALGPPRAEAQTGDDVARELFAAGPWPSDPEKISEDEARRLSVFVLAKANAKAQIVELALATFGEYKAALKKRKSFVRQSLVNYVLYCVHKSERDLAGEWSQIAAKTAIVKLLDGHRVCPCHEVEEVRRDNEDEVLAVENTNRPKDEGFTVSCPELALKFLVSRAGRFRDAKNPKIFRKALNIVNHREWLSYSDHRKGRDEDLNDLGVWFWFESDNKTLRLLSLYVIVSDKMEFVNVDRDLARIASACSICLGAVALDFVETGCCGDLCCAICEKKHRDSFTENGNNRTVTCFKCRRLNYTVVRSLAMERLLNDEEVRCLACRKTMKRKAFAAHIAIEQDGDFSAPAIDGEDSSASSASSTDAFNQRVLERERMILHWGTLQLRECDQFQCTEILRPCPNKARGCTFTGKLRELKTHLHSECVKGYRLLDEEAVRISGGEARIKKNCDSIRSLLGRGDYLQRSWEQEVDEMQARSQEQELASTLLQTPLVSPAEVP
eukprot:g11214.t1